MSTPDPIRAALERLVELNEGCTADHWHAAILAARAALGAALPVDPSKLSDGYHTFAELYEHRHSLMLALMRAMPNLCWFSQRHSDGDLPFDSSDWFIVGADLPTGPITYHMPICLHPIAKQTGAQELAIGRPWDGHTSDDVILRLQAWSAVPHTPPSPPAPAAGEVGEVVAELSPAAQAGALILAYCKGGDEVPHPLGFAAALEALTDQDETLFDENEELMPAVRAVRTDRILAIAAELRGGQADG